MATSSAGLITLFDYNADDRVSGTKVKKGSSGTAYYVSATDWGDGSTTPKYLQTATYAYPTKTATRSSGKKTTIAYTFWDTNKNQIKKRTTTLPSIPTSQNGPNTAAASEAYFDRLGRLRWTKDALGYVNYFSYQPDTGGLAYQAIDVDPSSMPADATGNDTKWVSANEDGDGNGTYADKPSRGGSLPTELELVSTTEYDDQGRPTERTDPGDAEHFTVYEDDRTIRFPYWDSTASECLQPIRVTAFDDGGRITETYAVDADYASISVSASEPTGFSSNPGQSDYVTWIRYTYDDLTNQLSTTDAYHDIPSSGTGTLSTNFDRTVLHYDDEGRRTHTIQIVSGTSTSSGVEQVTQFVYDVLGRAVEIKRGVSDDSHNMTSDYDTYPTLRTVSETIYDDEGVGDGHVTQVRRYHGTGAND